MLGGGSGCYIAVLEGWHHLAVSDVSIAVVAGLAKTPLKSPLAMCLLIRYTVQVMAKEYIH